MPDSGRSESIRHGEGRSRPGLRACCGKPRSTKVKLPRDASDDRRQQFPVHRRNVVSTTSSKFSLLSHVPEPSAEPKPFGRNVNVRVGLGLGETYSYTCQCHA
eukprot:4122065-Prymnesium_polylepis.1